MRLFLFLASFAMAITASARPMEDARGRIAACGFSSDRFLASKLQFNYAALVSPEFASGPAKPELCAQAVGMLSALPSRTKEEDLQLGLASVGFLATTLRNVVDLNGDLQIDEDFDPGDTARVPDKAILWIFNAQEDFLKYANLTGRDDVEDTVRAVSAECSRSETNLCGPHEEINATVVVNMRSLLKTLLFPPGR